MLVHPAINVAKQSELISSGTFNVQLLGLRNVFISNSYTLRELS